MDRDFSTMRDLGILFDVSSHVIGRWLVQIGLRTAEKEPSDEALANGYCKLLALDKGHSCFVWHITKTLETLRAHGHVPLRKPTLQLPQFDEAEVHRIVG